jgi:hypothetical protein
MNFLNVFILMDIWTQMLQIVMQLTSLFCKFLWSHGGVAKDAILS